MVLIPSYHYHRGETLREAGEYDAAIVQFEKADGYSDAEEQILATYYANGTALRDAGEYDTAIAQFEQADGYSDAEEQILAIYLVDLEIYLVTYLVAEAEEAQEPTMVQCVVQMLELV